jgi:hypothetical protein
MESKDHDERERSQNGICSLEWIAMAMDAARRYREAEQLGKPPLDDDQDDRVERETH